MNHLANADYGGMLGINNLDCSASLSSRQGGTGEPAMSFSKGVDVVQVYSLSILYY